MALTFSACGGNYSAAQSKELYSYWDDEPPFQLRFKLLDGKYFAAFEEGVEGMKLGAWRELLIPAKLIEKQGNLFYIVDVLEIQPL
jgi:hypothetical protein